MKRKNLSIVQDEANPRPRSRASGFALIYVLYVVLATSLLITTAIALMGNSFHRERQELAYHGQATNVARAGLVDAVNWFKLQASQPVRSQGTGYPYPDAAFQPTHSDSAKLDYTDDAGIGLVKEYALNDAGTLWGRYEVHRQNVDNSSNTGLTDTDAVHDITSQLGKGNAGEGLAWELESRGIVYLKLDAQKSYDESPNHVVESMRLSEQILALGLRRPAESAVLCGTASGINIGSNVRITGMPNGAAIAYKGGSGTPTPSTAPSGLTGSPSAYLSVASAQWFDDPQSVFGVSQSELKSLASINVTSVNSLPTNLPDMAITYIKGNPVFTASRPLSGGGILYVEGNLTISANSNSLYSGFIYVTGTITQNAPSLLSGMVIAVGGYAASGVNDVAQVEYSPTVLNTVRSQLCSYQEAKTPYVVH